MVELQLIDGGTATDCHGGTEITEVHGESFLNADLVSSREFLMFFYTTEQRRRSVV